MSDLTSLAVLPSSNLESKSYSRVGRLSGLGSGHPRAADLAKSTDH